MELPWEFLEWAYFERVKFIRSLVEEMEVSEAKFLLESTRHNPALCTAGIENDQIKLNAKIVGAGFVPKPDFIDAANDDLKIHVDAWGSISRVEYSMRGIQLLLKHLYFEDRQEAHRRIDFTKLSTLEIGASIEGSSAHTWKNVQSCRRALLLYYMPPTFSFEVRGELEVFTEGKYCEFVNLSHDSFHPPSSPRKIRPCYILNVEEVYNNSAEPGGFGRKLV